MTYIQLQQNWKLNHEHNNLLLSNIKDPTMELTSRQRGRTISDILQHMVKNRFDWLQHLTPALDYQTPDTNTSELTTFFEQSYNWVSDCISVEEEGTRIKGFKSDLFGFVIYLISHDSHHRGQIFQIMRDNKVKIEPKLQYGIWDWKY